MGTSACLRSALGVGLLLALGCGGTSAPLNPDAAADGAVGTGGGCRTSAACGMTGGCICETFLPPFPSCEATLDVSKRCATDSDCVSPHGSKTPSVCSSACGVPGPYPGQPPARGYCTAACETDDDCGSPNRCNNHRCELRDCASDSDCPGDAVCVDADVVVRSVGATPPNAATVCVPTLGQCVCGA